MRTDILFTRTTKPTCNFANPVIDYSYIKLVLINERTYNVSGRGIDFTCCPIVLIGVFIDKLCLA
jgi:hypothetical protein